MRSEFIDQLSIINLFLYSRLLKRNKASERKPASCLEFSLPSLPFCTEEKQTRFVESSVGDIKILGTKINPLSDKTSFFKRGFRAIWKIVGEF